MKISFNKLLVFFFLLIAGAHSSYGQLTVPNYTACPNQVIPGNVTWNNVFNTSYSVYAPPIGGPPIMTFVGPSTTFTMSQPLGCIQPCVGSYVYTVVGTGSTSTSGTITNTATFTLSIVPPQPLVLTPSQTNGIYCNGTNIVLTAGLGGTTYSYSGAGITPSTSPSNVITIPNAQANMGPQVTVVSVISGCTVTGVTNVQVSPLKSISISAPITACDGTQATVSFTANLTNGANQQWYNQNNSPILTGVSNDPGGSTTLTIGSPLTINNAGMYRVNIDDQFNGIPCPYTNTVQLNVIQTSPVLASASPSNVVCQGANINLSANTSVPASAWLWSGPSFNSSIASPILTSVVPPNSGAYTVTASFQGGFLTCTTSAVISLSVVPIAPPSITMPQSVCKDALVPFSGTTTVPGTFIYNWSGPLFATCSTCTSAISGSVSNVPVNASGTQYLTIRYTLPGSGLQCPVTASAQLNVVPTNTVSVIPPGLICEPTNAFLQSLATGASQYQWTGPGSFTGQGPNVWVYYPKPSNSGIYTVTAFFGGGNITCSSTNTLELIVNPVMNFSLIPRQQACFNSSVSLSGPAGATSYTWTSSTGYTSNNKDISFPSIQAANAGTYTLEISLGPCKSAGTSEIVVLDRISFSVTPFDRTVCRGDTIFLEGAASGGSENYAYTWNPAVYLQSSTGPQQQAIPLGSVMYNLIVHDIACPSYTIHHAFNVKVNQPPIPDLQLNTSEGCSPLCLSIDSKISKSAITTYDFGGKRVFQRDSTKFVYCLEDPGTYNLKIYTKGYNGCSNTFEYPYPLIVNPSPGADIYWNPEIPTTNDEITFYPTYKNDYPILYYNWHFLGGITEGDTTMNNSPGKADTTYAKNPKRKYPQNGEYPIVLVAQNDRGCTDTVYKIVKVIDEMQLFIPNSFTPNDDGINDLFLPKGSGIKLESYTMDIFTRAGTNVFTTKDINTGWDGRLGGQVMKDATYVYKIRVVGMNGEGRKEYTGFFTLIK